MFLRRSLFFILFLVFITSLNVVMGCSSPGGTGSATRVSSISDFFSIGHQNVTGLNAPGLMKVDSSGNLFVADRKNNRVVKYSSSGAFLMVIEGRLGQRVAGQADTYGRLNNLRDVAVDASGNIYILCSQPGRIIRFDANGVLSPFAAEPNTEFAPSGMYPESFAIDSAGNYFVVEGNGTDTVFKYDSSRNFLWSIGGVSGGSADGQFNRPNGIAMTSNGDFFIADTYNHRIQKFDNNGNFLAKVGAHGSSDLQFKYPLSVAWDNASNSLFIADRDNYRIQKTDGSFNFQSKWPTIVVPAAGVGNCEYTDLNGIAALTIASQQRIYVSDNRLHRIQILGDTSACNYISEFGLTGSANERLSNAIGLVKDSLGNFFVFDSNNFAIKKFSSTGAYLTEFGSIGSRNGQFHSLGSSKTGIVMDNSGNIWVVDRYSHRVQKFNSSGVWQLNITGALSYPGGLGYDSTNNLILVRNSVNNAIRRYSAATAAYQDEFGSPGSGNGQFNNQHGGIVMDSSGNYIIADSGNNRIQKINSTTLTYVSQFGSGGAGNGQFRDPIGLAIDSNNNLYVADMQNNRIQKFDSSGNYVSQFGSYGTGRGQFSGLSHLYLEGNYIYTTEEFNNRIQKFDLNGNLAY